VDFCATLPNGQQWPQARCLLVAQQVPLTVALPPDIELHRASHWLLEGAT